MVFNSFTFLIFFAIVLVLHNLPFSWTTKKFNLLIASYVFYAAWNPPFVILLWLTTLVDWNVARAIVRTDDTKRKRAWMLLSLIANLGLLGFFKYGGFVLSSFVVSVNALGIAYQAAPPNIILPIGISFYTFVTLSYTIDVYRGEIQPARSFLDFALLVTFFPHLVAGPILRASAFLPQCETERRATNAQFGWGLSLLVVGLFEKIVLADALLAPIADAVYALTKRTGFVDAWVGTLAFSGQILFDFEGYTLCAIGVALCLGFVFPDNFHFPYAAVGFSDFWKRWHISLSSWLRDYLYISLGGNRLGRARTYLNLMLTMLIGGLWHGASWLFVIWGGLHGLYLMVERLMQEKRGRRVESRPLFVGAIATYLLVCVTWVFFRAATLSGALTILGAMLNPLARRGVRGFGSAETLTVIAAIGLMLGVHWRLRDSSLEELAAKMPSWAWTCVLALLLLGILITPPAGRTFLYFQF